MTDDSNVTVRMSYITEGPDGVRFVPASRVRHPLLGASSQVGWFGVDRTVTPWEWFLGLLAIPFAMGFLNSAFEFIAPHLDEILPALYTIGVVAVLTLCIPTPRWMKS